jgi:hypothetical protein
MASCGVERALEIADDHAGHGEAHHKAWVIDQMLREILGEEYQEWITEWEFGGHGPRTYEWDKGIAPWALHKKL